MYLLNEVIHVLEEIAPPSLAESWDNVGLMIGSKNQKVSKILCALDLNEEVIEEALKEQAQCIVTHHPMFFKPLHKIDLDDPQGRLIKKLILHDLSVYTLHTNYDVAVGGVNDLLCEKLKLQNTQVLHISQEEHLYKVAVYVPETHYERFRNSIIAQDVCQLGEYKGCTFTLQGEGSFIPLEGSTPYLGKRGQLEKIQERKIEFVTRFRQLDKVKKLIAREHPYEEPAFDIYPLWHPKEVQGLGRYGELKEAVSLEEWVTTLKKVFNLSHIRMTKAQHAVIKKVALCSGSGASLIQAASKVAEVYVTGDIKFHDAQLARDLGLTVCDIGHYASENSAMKELALRLNNKLPGLWAGFSQVNAEMIYIK